MYSAPASSSEPRGSGSARPTKVLKNGSRHRTCQPSHSSGLVAQCGGAMSCSKSQVGMPETQCCAPAAQTTEPKLLLLLPDLKQLT